MCQCILKFCVISLCVINKLFITIYVTGELVQDWSQLLRKPYDQEEPISERGYLQDTEPPDHDDDANNPCPIVKNGQHAPQPWDINSVHGTGKPWHPNSPGVNNINNEKYNEQENVQESNCKDDTSDVVIKILFNRDEPCDKKKTIIRFDQNSKYQVFSKPGVNVNISNTHNNMWKK
ncbi:hypothetical protein KQX54_004834 [Cotesia glomerata]|uniref:Uncharacterized protein n=1 Tax=Cotesia glomerata TaxID=32391 RepID=A0AAV7J273_COTGL|nr:hypothetical protein KQX54_004834 [Cotesia glomerata]